MPFFLGPPVAVARGRGERLAPGPALPPCAIALGTPRPAARDARRVRRLRAVGPLPAGLPAPSTVEELAALVANDLGPAAEALEPACRSLREGLVAAGALAASVTGSGSAVFGVFREADEAERALGGLRDAAWTGRATLRAA